MATKDDLSPGALGPLPEPTPPKRRLTTDEIKQVENARPKTGIVREHYTDAPPVSDGVPEPIGKDTDRVVRMDFHCAAAKETLDEFLARLAFPRGL